MHDEPSCPRYGKAVTGHLSPCTCNESVTMTDQYPQCTGCDWCDNCADMPSDEAIAKLRTLLSEPSIFEDEPVVLTVYTAHGNVTVENVDESSVRLNAGVLTCEERDGSSNCPLFTFGSVIGYRTTFRLC